MATKLSLIHKAIADTEIKFDDPNAEKQARDAAASLLRGAFKDTSPDFVLKELAFIDRTKGPTEKARTAAYAQRYASLINVAH